MATDPVHVGSYRPFSPARIFPAHTTRPVFVFASADAGAGPPVTAGGSRLFGLSAAQFQSTPAALSVRLFAARRLTKVSDMGTASITTNTITRTTGNFITDGWLVGDSVGLRNTTNVAAVDNAQITAVSATTLTFAASTFTAETPPATAEFWRLHLLSTSTLASGAGSTAAPPLLTSSPTPSPSWTPRPTVPSRSVPAPGTSPRFSRRFRLGAMSISPRWRGITDVWGGVGAAAASDRQSGAGTGRG